MPGSAFGRALTTANWLPRIMLHYHRSITRGTRLVVVVAALLLPNCCMALSADGPPLFERDVLPVLTAAGCNSGLCHGKAKGQNGFRLSLWGFDAAADYASIALESRGRRVSPSMPDESLLLRKASAAVRHGGGERLPAGSSHYEVLRRWIAAGMPRSGSDDARLVRIAIEPPVLRVSPGDECGVSVTACYSDGSRRNVTSMCAYQSSDPALARIDESGRVTAARLAGETVVMVRYADQMLTATVQVPPSKRLPHSLYEHLPRNNFIDGLVWDRLSELGLAPADTSADHTFLRRAWLDILGRLPPPADVRHFLADRSPGKRSRLINELVSRPEFADYWASKWADLLRPNAYRVGIKATIVFDAWLRDALRQNLPYDEFARQIVTAQGSTWRDGPAVLYRDRRTPEEMATLVSQVFLGVRLECARCHHHPFERWSQSDFYAFAAHFARVGRKGAGLLPPTSGGEEMIFAADEGSLVDPCAGTEVAPRTLGSDEPTPLAGHDPREALADWMTSPDNPYFASVAVNRVWADLMGGGLVEPVDDLRATNPASNPRLLVALERDFRANGYDLRQLVRTIAGSHVYSLSSMPREPDSGDPRHEAHHARRRMRAEVLLDAVSQLTGAEEPLAAMPAGSRAVELWTTRIDSLLLDTFGRPDANQAPPCSRTSETSIVQALHLMNSPRLDRKIAAEHGRAATLAAGSLAPAELIDEIYLAAYSRFPSADERTVALGWFESVPRREAIEDLMWTLINTPEFLFVD